MSLPFTSLVSLRFLPVPSLCFPFPAPPFPSLPFPYRPFFHFSFHLIIIYNYPFCTLRYFFPSSALMNELFPALNSPTTTRRKSSSSCCSIDLSSARSSVDASIFSSVSRRCSKTFTSSSRTASCSFVRAFRRAF